MPVFWNIALSFQDLRLIELQDFNFFSTDVSLDNYRLVTSGDFGAAAPDLRVRVRRHYVAMVLGLWAALVVRSAFAAGVSSVASCCSPTWCRWSPPRCCGGRCSTRSTASSTHGWMASAPNR